MEERQALYFLLFCFCAALPHCLAPLAGALLRSFRVYTQEGKHSDDFFGVLLLLPLLYLSHKFHPVCHSFLPVALFFFLRSYRTSHGYLDKAIGTASPC